MLLTLATAAWAGAPVSPLVDELLPRVVKVMGLPAPKNQKVKPAILRSPQWHQSNLTETMLW